MPLEQPQEGFTSFDDRYVSDLRCDEVLTPPRMKSVVVIVEKEQMVNVDPTADSSKINIGNLFPRPRPVLINDLSKVLTFICRFSPSNHFHSLSLLDINPDTYIPEYFCDFLTLA